MALHSSLNEASKLAVAAVFKVGVPAPGLSPTTGNGRSPCWAGARAWAKCWAARRWSPQSPRLSSPTLTRSKKHNGRKRWSSLAIPQCARKTQASRAAAFIVLMPLLCHSAGRDALILLRPTPCCPTPC